MLTPDDAQFITDAVSSLALPLHEGLDKGREVAHGHYDLHEMTGSGYTKGRTDLTRDHARRYLEELDDLGGWKINRTASGRILLNSGLMLVKVLHGSPNGEVPAPGRNKARLRYYSNPASVDLFGVESSRLLAVWVTDTETGEITVRIVRPVGVWKIGRPIKADLDFILPRDADDFSKLEFVPDSDDLELPFFIDEDDDKREEGESGGA